MRKMIAILSLILVLAPVIPAFAQSEAELRVQKLAETQMQLQRAEARLLFNTGRDFFDDGRYADAEKKFREVLARYSQTDQGDKSAYYLIATLAKLGRGQEALAEITKFQRNYPQSSWMSDVLEKRMSLTNEVPANLSARIFQEPPTREPLVFLGPEPSQAPATPEPAPVVPTSFGRQVGEAVTNGIIQGIQSGIGAGIGSGIGAAIATPFGTVGNRVDPEISLQQEILRVMLRNNPDRGIDLAVERLAADPADPVVISNLNAIANSGSAKALPTLISIAKTSASPRARQEATFWIARSPGDKDALVNTLLEILNTGGGEETDNAVASALAQMNTPRAQEALSTIMRDNNRSINARRTALNRITRNDNAGQVSLSVLEDLYRSSSSSVEFRRALVQSIGRTTDARAVSVLAGIAKTDADMAVRRSAIQALGTRQEPEALRALEDLLRNMPPVPRGANDQLEFHYERGFEHEFDFSEWERELEAHRFDLEHAAQELRHLEWPHF